jgi:hypothetical protein
MPSNGVVEVFQSPGLAYGCAPCRSLEEIIFHASDSKVEVVSIGAQVPWWTRGSVTAKSKDASHIPLAQNAVVAVYCPCEIGNLPTVDREFMDKMWAAIANATDSDAMAILARLSLRLQLQPACLGVPSSVSGDGFCFLSVLAQLTVSLPHRLGIITTSTPDVYGKRILDQFFTECAKVLDKTPTSTDSAVAAAVANVQAAHSVFHGGHFMLERKHWCGPELLQALKPLDFGVSKEAALLIFNAANGFIDRVELNHGEFSVMSLDSLRSRKHVLLVMKSRDHYYFPGSTTDMDRVLTGEDLLAAIEDALHQLLARLRSAYKTA